MCGLQTPTPIEDLYKEDDNNNKSQLNSDELKKSFQGSIVKYKITNVFKKVDTAPDLQTISVKAKENLQPTSNHCESVIMEQSSMALLSTGVYVQEKQQIKSNTETQKIIFNNSQTDSIENAKKYPKQHEIFQVVKASKNKQKEKDNIYEGGKFNFESFDKVENSNGKLANEHETAEQSCIDKDHLEPDKMEHVAQHECSSTENFYQDYFQTTFPGIVDNNTENSMDCPGERIQ